MLVGVRRSSLLRKALAAVASLSSIAFVPPAAIAKRHPACTEAIARCKVTECASLSDDERGACEQVCDAQCSGPRTLAYVVTECCQAPGDPPTVTQALKIRRQNRATQTVRSLPAKLPGGLQDCRTWRDGRGGLNRRGVFYRLGVGRDGSVAYEVTNEFASVDNDKLKPDQEGIFLLRPDGQTLPLGKPSHDPSVRPRPTEDTNDQAVFTFDSTFAFSPDGRRIAFTESLGPFSKDEDPVQIWVLAVRQGERNKVTRLPATDPPKSPNEKYSHLKIIQGLSFLDDDTIGFLTYANPHDLNSEHTLALFTIKVDGTRLRRRAGNLPGGLKAQRLSITRSLTTFGQAELGGDTSLNSSLCEPEGGPIREFFLARGKDLLRTNFRRNDTGYSSYRVGRRLFFTSSGNVPSANTDYPNPTDNCQLFSIGTLGAPLQQHTHISGASGKSRIGCGCFGPPPGCFLQAAWDALSRTALFYSDCDDPGGMGIHINPSNTTQFFAGRSDGGELRQLTHTRGEELIGQYAF